MSPRRPRPDDDDTMPPIDDARDWPPLRSGDVSGMDVEPFDDDDADVDDDEIRCPACGAPLVDDEMHWHGRGE